MKKLLVTGAAGRVAANLIPELRKRFDLRLTDHVPASDSAIEVAGLEDGEAVRKLCEGMDLVLHLGAAARLDSSFEDILPANIVGAYNVFESARRAGCRRVVFASSVHAGMRPTREPEAGVADVGFGPDTLYGASKVWGEALASLYSGREMSCLCLRLGWVASRDIPKSGHPREDLVLVPEDLHQLTVAALEAPESLRFGVFWALSSDQVRGISIDETRRLLGFVPSSAKGGRRNRSLGLLGRFWNSR